jgi:hypothetical protein
LSTNCFIDNQYNIWLRFLRLALLFEVGCRCITPLKFGTSEIQDNIETEQSVSDQDVFGSRLQAQAYYWDNEVTGFPFDDRGGFHPTVQRRSFSLPNCILTARIEIFPENRFLRD